MHRDPFFLFGTAESHEQQIGASLAHPIGDLDVIQIQQFAKRRGVMPGDDQTRVASTGLGHRLRGGFRRRAEEVQAEAASRRKAQQQRHQIRAGDPLRQRVAEQPRGPEQRGTVAQHQVRIQ